VKHLVEAHGGAVTVESPGEGQGATFRVQLPIIPVYADDPEVALRSGLVARRGAPPVVAATMLNGLSVLVVDDDDDSRDLVAATVERHGAVVSTAGSATEALRVLADRHIDVLLSDLAMPDVDGYSLIRAIRAQHGAALPAAALTALAREDDRDKAFQAGFNAHLAKPIDAVSLVDTVLRLASRSQLL
jgi:CheY-like chemotaxis protein